MAQGRERLRLKIIEFRPIRGLKVQHMSRTKTDPRVSNPTGIGWGTVGRMLRATLVGPTLACIWLGTGVAPAAQNPAIVRTEFVYDHAPFPSCHASTIAVSGGHLIAAWFGGTDEGNKDVGIWSARHDGKRWTAPVEVANGIESPRRRYPCWNPALYQVADGPLLLFYKVGPHPSTWWGMLTTSTDHGKTWSKPVRLPPGILGPIKNKPVMLAGGRLLCGSSTEDHGWRVHLEWTDDLGRHWAKSGPLNDGTTIGAIQPTILCHHGGVLQILCRTRRSEKIAQSSSVDGGKTWSPLTATSLPNPNSGIDAATLRDGRHVLVYNHTTRGRSPLNVAVSPDGQTWFAAAVLEDQPGEYSYPAVIQAPDGLVHVTYTWRRERIRHVVLDPARLQLRKIVAGQWP